MVFVDIFAIGLIGKGLKERFYSSYIPRRYSGSPETPKTQQIYRQPTASSEIVKKSEPTRQIAGRDSSSAVNIGGVEREFGVISDGDGGLIAVQKTTGAHLSATERGIGLQSVEDYQLAHISREAIQRNPDNPDIRVISSTEMSRINFGIESN